MARLSADEHAFIRPSPSAGTLGGVACKTRESMYVCEAAGYDVIIVETVGVGQSEIVVADMTDCCLALLLPGAGDELQAIKRGLMERVDAIAVNKSDGETRQAAQVSAQQLRGALNSISQRDADRLPVLTCSALHDDGVDLVWQAIEKRHLALETSGELIKRRQLQNISWLWRMVDQRLREAVRSHPAVSEIRDTLEREVLLGTETPASAARTILEAFGCPSDRGEPTAED
jgi:LAO/AO transport system kinase